jgi:3-deoxy-manno-octulosonate cytidylyltransferase (CMP-KDO synthetase)
MVRGSTMIRRVMAIATAADGVDQVIVATDHQGIAAHVREFGGDVAMTPAECRNGTERVHAAALALDQRPDVVINFQGDAVLTPPWIIGSVANAMRANHDILMATPAVRMDRLTYDRFRKAKAAGEVGGTTVVTRRDGYAMYFSKALIPALRFPVDPLPVKQHIGLYAYRFETLEALIALQPSPLEEAEGLEQLRALENSVPIKVIEVDYRGRSHASIDSQKDVPIVERLIEEQGELVPL